MAVTTQETLDGIREKAMRIASIDELETGSSAGRWSSPGRAPHDKTKPTSLSGLLWVRKRKQEKLSSPQLINIFDDITGKELPRHANKI